MAIISIPSSIGGVSIPGAVLKGPLAKLFNSGSSIATYSYPRDLGSSTRGHWIKFYINEIQPTQYYETNITGVIKGAAKAYKENDLTAGVAIGNTAVGVAKELGNLAASAYTDTFKLKPRKNRLDSTVSLYMPDGLSFTNQASYNGISLLDAAQSALNAIKSLDTTSKGKKAGEVGIIGSLAGGFDTVIGAVRSDVGKLALSTQGLAINPGQQMLFDAIDFRSYSLSFTFTPYSKEESETVKEIIKLFKTHAAPKISDSGMFFIPPSTFNLEFYHNNGVNTNIPKVAESVIESIEVNYAPNGWSAHTDGAPVQTTMTISFKEIELIDRKKIQENGF